MIDRDRIDALRKLAHAVSDKLGAARYVRGKDPERARLFGDALKHARELVQAFDNDDFGED